MSYQRLEKLNLTCNFLDHAEKIKTQLLHELVLTATDDVFFLRRFRMLQQLAVLEQQALGKIYNFDTDDLTDYAKYSDELIKELYAVCSRNA
jgi:hypothetical protein